MDLLHPVEVRVLGALLEKDITTPEYYPLTLNSLQNACNQKSSRDPVVAYDEDTVAQALELLKNKGLAIRISGAGHRVEKFGHRLGEKLNLGRRELALLCVLMLRGPQTVGELRSRTERMHDFADMEEVERVLESLAGHDPDPLVAHASRGRWAHLFTGAVSDSAPDPEPAPAMRSALDDRVAALEREVEQLKQQFERFRQQFE
ncbi:MAG TPA: YceH family protein [Bryobacteraceae bacterium]|nr:YceH family protein [Bryobacteraceae bacterium]